jgi:hypothetical protein
MPVKATFARQPLIRSSEQFIAALLARQMTNLLSRGMAVVSSRSGATVVS